jgi:FkbM family methyltransferase
VITAAVSAAPKLPAVFRRLARAAHYRVDRRTLREIQSAEVAAGLKKRISRTYVRTFLLERGVSDSRANIVGFDVRFRAFWSLSFQFEEIFLGHQYLFTATERAPFIVDCGSNIGMSVLYFKMLYPDAQILAFEPDPSAFACLQENMQRNAFSDVRLENKALGDFDGQVDFFYDQADPGSLRMSTLKERMARESRLVEGVRLSRYVDRDIDFLKLDIEGAETAVVEELGRAKKLRRIRQMIVEYHHHVVRQEDDLSRIFAVLEEAGFGYQVEGRVDRPLPRERSQDIRIYAYRKSIAA